MTCTVWPFTTAEVSVPAPVGAIAALPLSAGGGGAALSWDGVAASLSGTAAPPFGIDVVPAAAPFWSVAGGWVAGGMLSVEGDEFGCANAAPPKRHDAAAAARA